MRTSVLVIAALSALWTAFLTLGAYMTPTGIIETRTIIVAAVPLVVSLAYTLRGAVKGSGWFTTIAATLVALTPFAFLALVAIQQQFFPFGLAGPQ